MTRLCFALLLLAGCGADPSEEKPDIRVVVIETNVPDGPDGGPDPCPYRYEADDATRACGDAAAPPHICSSIELCEAQQTYIFDAFASCQLDEGAVDADRLPDCP